MANTTWNPSDKAPGITLSGGNLVATLSSANGLVRSVDRQASGKFYFELTANNVSGINYYGLVVGTIATTSVGTGSGSAAGTAWINNSGTLWVDGNNIVAFPTVTAGSVLCFAVDLTNSLLWIRIGSGGNWNNVAGNNPATGAGGVSISSLGNAFPAFVGFYANTTGAQTTANFGDSAFVGTVPSGFTSGFTAGASLPTNEIATQLAAEHWASITTFAQITQVSIEEWADGNPLAQVTQVAIEEWAALPPPPLWVTQVAIEHWASGSMTVQIAVTQVAMEHWVGSPPATTTHIGPMITTIF